MGLSKFSADEFGSPIVIDDRAFRIGLRRSGHRFVPRRALAVRCFRASPIVRRHVLDVVFLVSRSRRLWSGRVGSGSAGGPAPQLRVGSAKMATPS
jgi:hypothetical protein